ncbi:hypothetical protein [Dactylococcopsis salina]|uniref:hypothetical protein n=1 Tax=Dactylococcopsis salina TaxID=292566 RepID=UPI0002D6DCC4|nr:hypothetical protein [Dactylococcopsis salina]
MLKKSIGWLSKAREMGKMGEMGEMGEMGKKNRFLNLIASNPYLVKLSVSQQEALNNK